LGVSTKDYLFYNIGRFKMGRTYSSFLVDELYRVQKKIADHTGDEPLVLTDWDKRVLAQFPDSIPTQTTAMLIAGIIVVSFVLVFAIVEWMI
jgi:hypothetical protein